MAFGTCRQRRFKHDECMYICIYVVYFWVSGGFVTSWRLFGGERVKRFSRVSVSLGSIYFGLYVLYVFDMYCSFRVVASLLSGTISPTDLMTKCTTTRRIIHSVRFSSDNDNARCSGRLDTWTKRTFERTHRSWDRRNHITRGERTHWPLHFAWNESTTDTTQRHAFTHSSQAAKAVSITARVKYNNTFHTPAKNTPRREQKKNTWEHAPATHAQRKLCACGRRPHRTRSTHARATHKVEKNYHIHIGERPEQHWRRHSGGELFGRHRVVRCHSTYVYVLLSC